MASVPEKNELVLIFSRIMLPENTVASVIHRQRCELGSTRTSGDVWGPIPFRLLKNKDVTICPTCYPPSNT
jgi:hypothetical protein